jgi:endonuclease V-like protein UPF0215 family
MNVIGFDDGPFARDHRGNVLLVGVVCAGTRVDGVVSGQVRRDGTDSTRRMIELVEASQFRGHVRAILLQGIAVAGFNVVDIHALSRGLGVPVVVVTRKKPRLETVRRALFSEDPPDLRPRVRGAERKWRLIVAAGEMEELGVSHRAEKRAKVTGLRAEEQRLWVQRVGLSLADARELVRGATLHGNVPEPLRLAHLIAGGIVTGKSRGRV